MRRIFIILIGLIGCTSLLKAEEVVADSSINYIQLVSAQDTLVYYPTGAFGAIPEAYVKAELSSTDSTLLTAQIAFTDCQLHYIWVPANSGIEATDPYLIALRVNEVGATYEVRFSTTEPQGAPAETTQPQVRKLLRNGQVIIIRNGAEYTLMGQKQ